MNITLKLLFASFASAVLIGVCQWAVAATPDDSEPPLGAWSGDRSPPATAEDPAKGQQIEPPAMSFGFQGCRQYGIWVFLKNGKSYRYDSEHHQIKSAEEMKTLLPWLNKGPSDIITIQCIAGMSA